MATYLELRSLFNDGDLVNRVSVAAVIAVNVILNGTPTTKDKAYAALLFSNPQSEAKKILMGVLAANSNATVDQIQTADDTALQGNVDTTVLILIDALAGV